MDLSRFCLLVLITVQWDISCDLHKTLSKAAMCVVQLHLEANSE